MSDDREIRDWEPGDGLRCSYAKNSPIPCGPPAKTRVQIVTMVGRKARETKHVLCALHAANAARPTTLTVNAEAQRIANERLISEHWDDYNRYLDEAVAKLIAEVERP